MPLFQYHALGATGKKRIGTITADSTDLAKELLRKQELFVTEILPFKKKEITLKKPALIAFTRDIASLLRSGLPLYESFVTLEEKHAKHPSHPLFLDLCDQIKQGTKLSQILKKYPKTFDQVYIAMVKSGEESGNLEEIFDELSQMISEEQRVRKQIISALIYPGFLLSFCFLVVSGLMFFLIPSLKELFEGKRLHPMTEAVLGVSEWLQANGLALLTLLIVGIFGMVVFFRSARGRALWKASLLRIPILSRMVSQAVLFRFSSIFSALLAGGLPLLEALQLAKNVMHHPSFETVVSQAEREMLQGGKLSSELSRSPLFPRLYIRMLSVAEESGTMPKMLHNIAKIYQDELERSLSRITTLLQPVILLFLGAIIGVILLAVLLPLTDVGSFID